MPIVEIERDDGLGAGFVAVGTRTGVWFTDLTVSADTTYSYRVIAFDGDGDSSDPSPTVVVSTLP